MSLFVISDLHLSTGAGTDKSMEVFGKRWKNYVERIETNWKQLVSPEDTVVVPGDISWAMTLEEARDDFAFLNSLPGQKIISKGNHDFWWATQAKIDAFFAEHHFDTIRCLHNNAHFAEGFLICGSRGWYNDPDINSIPSGTDYEKIVRRESMRLEASLTFAEKNFPDSGAEKLVFLHFPPIFQDFRCEEILAVMKKHNVQRCFYGHIHGPRSFPLTFLDDGITFSLVAADQIEFIPRHIPFLPQ